MADRVIIVNPETRKRFRPSYLPSCKHHGKDRFELVRSVQSNGRSQFHLACVTDGTPSGRCVSGYIHCGMTTAAERLSCRTIATTAPRLGEACERCGVVGSVQVHHWAPRALFDDASMWPTSKLCAGCHKHWHDVVTPQLVRGRK